MAEKAGSFDASGFYQALDAERASRKLNWKQVAEQSGISASTLTRLAQGKKPDVDSMSALVAWSGLNSSAFIRTASKSEASGFSQSLALLRSDPHLSTENAAVLEKMLRAAYEQLRED